MILKQSFLSLIFRVLTLVSGLVLYKVVFEQYSKPSDKVLITTAIATLGSLNLLDFGIGHGFRNLFQNSVGNDRKLLLVNLFVQNGVVSFLILVIGLVYSILTSDYLLTTSLPETLKLMFFILLLLLIRPVRFIWLAQGKAQILVLQQVFVNVALIVIMLTINVHVTPFLVVLGFIVSQMFFYGIGLFSVIRLEGKFWNLDCLEFRLDKRIISDGIKIFFVQVVAFVCYGLLPYYMSKNVDQDQSLSFNYWWKIFSSLNGIVTMVLVPVWHSVASKEGDKGSLKKIYFAGLSLVTLYSLCLFLIQFFDVNLVSIIYAIDVVLYEDMVALLSLLSSLLVLTALFGNIWNGQSKYEILTIGALVQLITFVFLLSNQSRFVTFPIIQAVLISTLVGFLASMVYVKIITK